MINNTSNTRIFAQGKIISNDSYATGLNNNDLIIGPSGGGKTTGYVIPNVNRHYGSYIIADTKGNLSRKLGPSLRRAGYKVNTLDFVNPEYSCRYNPLDFIGRKGKDYSEEDVMRIASMLSPVRSVTDPFWEESAQTVIAALIAFVLETFPKQEQNLVSVNKLYKMMTNPNFGKLFTELEVNNPDSFAVAKFKSSQIGKEADRTWSCILQFVSRALRIFDMRSIEKMAKNTQHKVDFKSICSEPNVLFVNVSDTERSMDPLANIFYSQMFQNICRIADENPNSRLDIPVQVILDDFATNVFIPNFDKIISVIRSRNISASLIVQSISQLNSLYGADAALTIINNCDHILYLGGQDLGTADLIAARVNKSRETVLSMPLNKAYLIERGGKSELVDKITPAAETSGNTDNAGGHTSDDITDDFDCIDDDDLPW